MCQIHPNTTCKGSTQEVCTVINCGSTVACTCVLNSIQANSLVGKEKPCKNILSTFLQTNRFSPHCRVNHNVRDTIIFIIVHNRLIVMFKHLSLVVRKSLHSSLLDSQKPGGRHKGRGQLLCVSMHSIFGG